MSDYWNEYFEQEGLEEKLKIKFSELVGSFKKETEGLIKRVIGDLESEYLPYLFEDTSQNLRNVLMNAMESDAAKTLREKLIREFRDQIENETIKDLEQTIKILEERELSNSHYL